MNSREENFLYIKTHPRYPFRTYRTSDFDYMCLELYWTYLFKCVIGDNTDATWVAFHPPDVEHEGNPIFSARNLDRGRIVRIIHKQDENRDLGGLNPGTYFPFQPFMSEYHDPISGDHSPELCFVADLSAESENQARRFLAAFCVDYRSVSEMEGMIIDYEESVGMLEPEKED